MVIVGARSLRRGVAPWAGSSPFRCGSDMVIVVQLNTVYADGTLKVAYGRCMDGVVEFGKVGLLSGSYFKSSLNRHRAVGKFQVPWAQDRKVQIEVSDEVTNSNRRGREG